MTPPEGADADALARACAEAMWPDDHASRSMGMVLGHITAGRACMSLVVIDTMVNGHGICHGGFIFALADSAMAFAANSRGERAVAQHNSITYVRPVRLGETLIAHAEERVIVGRSGIYDVHVTGSDGSIVAEFRGHSRLSGGRLLTED